MTPSQFDIVEMVELYVPNILPFAIGTIDDDYYWGDCPFCGDIGSLIIARHKHKFYCFNCYARGNGHKFIKLMAAKENNG